MHNKAFQQSCGPRRFLKSQVARRNLLNLVVIWLLTVASLVVYFLDLFTAERAVFRLFIT
jgi:hypothetical protein